MSKQLQLHCLTALVTLAGSIACRPKEMELPFETVMQGEPQLLNIQGENYRATYKSMDLMVATNQAQVQQIADPLSPERYNYPDIRQH